MLKLINKKKTPQQQKKKKCQVKLNMLFKHKQIILSNI